MLEIDIEFAKTVIASEANAVAGLTGLVTSTPFADAVRMILECKGSVIVTGMGKAGIIGEKVSATLASTGTASHFLHPAEAVHGDLGRVRPRDIVLALSHSGESAEIVRLIEPLKQQEIPMIAIVGDRGSRLAKHSDVSLCMGMLDEACPLGVAPSVSTTCMLAVGDALALTVMKTRNFSAEEYARYHPGGALGARLLTVGQTMWFKHGEPLPIANVGDTIQQMLDKTSGLKRRGAVMVTNGDGKLAGIITDADLRRTMSKFGQSLFDKPVSEIMTANCKRVT